ncbi:MAG: hypothetical protein V3S68_07080, partial [Dehalococcoidia bacterium]
VVFDHTLVGQSERHLFYNNDPEAGHQVARKHRVGCSSIDERVNGPKFAAGRASNLDWNVECTH